MSVFLITYDLRSPGRDYKNLYEAIKRLGKWTHPLESVWTVSSGSEATVIRDALVLHMDKNDGLLVLRVRNAAWSGIESGPALKAMIEAM